MAALAKDRFSDRACLSSVEFSFGVEYVRTVLV
jgi:hypothetical protein